MYNPYLAFSVMVITNKPLHPRHVKFDMKIYHNHIPKYYESMKLLLLNYEECNTFCVLNITKMLIMNRNT
jgi:hypothetical protein